MGNLRRNLKTHSGEKPNKCNQCDFACSDPSSLRTHLKAHSGEKTNKCNQCGYASSRADHLRTYLKRHNGEKQTKLTPFIECTTSYCPSQYISFLLGMTDRLPNQRAHHFRRVESSEQNPRLTRPYNAKMACHF